MVEYVGQNICIRTVALTAEICWTEHLAFLL